MGHKPKNLFRMPIDIDHSLKTLQKGIRYEEIEGFLNKDQKAELNRLNLKETIRCWGSLPGSSNRKNWALLEENDEILCYRNGKYIYLGIIGPKIVNKELAKYLWGEDKFGSTWELMYFFKKLHFLNLPIENINTQFGYKAGPVMGFNVISKQIANPFISKFGSILNFIKTNGLESQTKEQLKQKLIESPYEAQYYLLELGRILKYDTYLPPVDGGRKIFNRKLSELATVTKDQLSNYIGRAFFDPISNIDVLWLTEGFRPFFSYEVVYKTGMKEAFARLRAVHKAFGNVKNRILGDEAMEFQYDKVKRLYYPDTEVISYKNFTQLLEAHTSAVDFDKVLDSFLAD